MDEKLVSSTCVLKRPCENNHDIHKHKLTNKHLKAVRKKGVLRSDTLDNSKS